MCFTREWHSVCAKEFSEREREVVCFQLGYSNGPGMWLLYVANCHLILVTTKFGHESYPIHPFYIHCSGSEQELGMCSTNTQQSVMECREVAGVICQGLP